MEESDVLKSTIFLTISGSRSYGTDTIHSDTDVRGICIPTDRHLYHGLGLHQFEQKSEWKTRPQDTVIYDLRKALRLMADGTPNMLELLFTPERFWIESELAWLKIRENRQVFLSKKLRFTFGGYAFSQLRRIRGHRSYLLKPPTKKPERADFGLEDKKLVSNDELQSFLWLVSKMLKNSVEEMKVSEQTRAELGEVNYIGLMQSKMGQAIDEADAHILHRLTGAPDGFIESCMREKRYLAACRDFDAYQAWKTNRNDKRRALEEKYGYDCKHAMHLVRLLRMALEIFRFGQVNVFREDRDELLAIRNGEWPFDYVEDFAEKAEMILDKLYEKSTLPRQVNIKAVEALCVELVEDALSADR